VCVWRIENRKSKEIENMETEQENDDRFACLPDGSNVESEEELEEDEGEEEEELGRISPEVKRKKPGVIYLSSVPDGMNVSQTTAFFSEFGRVGRVFLQPDKTDKQKGKYNRVFSEGWVEFLSKKVARTSAERLNCQPVGGKRRSKAHDQIWNIKYLPRFKWVHLSERLAYEAAVRQQRLRTEISQVKREAEHFKNSVETKRKKPRLSGKTETEDLTATEQQPAPFQFQQKETESQIRKRKVVADGLNSEAPEIKKKKKKTKNSSKSVTTKDSTNTGGGFSSEKVKSKKSQKTENRSRGKSRETGDRSTILKSVFGASPAV